MGISPCVLPMLHSFRAANRYEHSSAAKCVTACSYLFFYANSEPQPNAKYSCAASVAIAR